MAERIESFEVTVTAGTVEAAPSTTAIEFAPAEVEAIEVWIPAGHAGLTGFQLCSGGSNIIPVTAGAFLRGNDEVIRWPLSGFPNAGDWQCRAFNLDIYDHTFLFRFLLTEIVAHPAAGFRIVTPLAV